MANLSKCENRFTYEEALSRIAISFAAHPFDYVKILIQLGYEPIPPHPTKTIFGRERLALPSVFKYMGYIRRTDGFFGIYRGLSYKLAATLVNGFVYVNVNEWQKASQKKSTDEDEQQLTGGGIDAIKLHRLLRNLTRETISRFVALSLSYPFHVMTIRVCAQFVGKEHNYDTLIGAIADIYQTGGIAGFYAGFAPRFVGDVLILWIGSSIVFVINSWIDSENTVKGYIAASVNYIITSLMYPFQLVSTVLCCNGPSARSLAASRLTGPAYLNWVDCWKNLSDNGQLKRGSSLWFRYQHSSHTSFYQYKPVQNREFKNCNFMVILSLHFWAGLYLLPQYHDATPTPSPNQI